ncbi:MAG: gliding motility protein [Bacteroidetes bacterium]|nr:gliding motility protein [Bacteroidota bacterium]
MKAILSYFSFISLIIILLSCGSDDTRKIQKVPVNIEIIRFDQELMQTKTKEELAALFQKNPEYVQSMYNTFPGDTALISHVFYLSQHPETRKLYDYTLTQFGDFKKLTSELEGAFKAIKFYYPDFKVPKVMTTFSGLENDISVSDSLIIIALEAFAGPKAPYRPEQPNYILSRYSPDYIVPTVVRFLSNPYNKLDPNDQSFVADMMFFGKSLEFTKQMLPNVADSLIIGYSDAQLKETWNAQDLVWAHIVDKNLLQEKNPAVKNRYFGERPNVPEIGPSCPGRIGQWLGWRIIQKYRTENPKVTFQNMMADANPNEILLKSKYRGQTEE